MRSNSVTSARNASRNTSPCTTMFTAIVRRCGSGRHATSHPGTLRNQSGHGAGNSAAFRRTNLTAEQRTYELKKTELEQLKAIAEALGQDLPSEPAPPPQAPPMKTHVVAAGERHYIFGGALWGSARRNPRCESGFGFQQTQSGHSGENSDHYGADAHADAVAVIAAKDRSPFNQSHSLHARSHSAGFGRESRDWRKHESRDWVGIGCVARG